MKKSLLVFGGLLISTTIGSAATIQIDAACSTSGGNAVGSSPSFTNISVVCGNFANVNGGVQLDAGFTLLDAFVVFQNDYSQGANGSATATFVWNNINSNLAPPTTYTDTVTGGFQPQTYVPSVTSIYDPLTTGSCSTEPGVFPIVVSGGCANNPTAFLGASTTFTAADVSGNGSNLQPNGSIGTAAYVFFDYSTPASSAPEPSTLGLCGVMIGLGAIGRKRIRG